MNLIIPKENPSVHEVPFQHVALHVVPQEQPTAARPLGGFYILSKLPTKPIRPQPFVKDCHIELQKTFAQVQKVFAAQPHVIQQWQEWMTTECPPDDNHVSWVESHPLRVPFKCTLFPDQTMAPTRTGDGELVIAATMTANPRKQLHAISAPSLTWSGRPKPCQREREILPFTLYDETDKVVEQHRHPPQPRAKRVLTPAAPEEPPNAVATTTKEGTSKKNQRKKSQHPNLKYPHRLLLLRILLKKPSKI